MSKGSFCLQSSSPLNDENLLAMARSLTFVGQMLTLLPAAFPSVSQEQLFAPAMQQLASMPALLLPQLLHAGTGVGSSAILP